MIWFNNDDYVLTPNYYVQSLFSNNRGDYSLPTDVKMNGIEKDDTLHGGVVVGSWGTHNEFKDFVITSDEKQEISDKKNFEAVSGEWKIRDDGVIEQTSDETGCVFYINQNDLNNYTFSCKAKKTAGGEGFQIGVAAADAKNYYRVNIGGWGNTTAKVQRIVDGVSAETGNVAEQSYVGNVHINDNEWYDVKVEVTDYEIKAYLNDEFICSYTKPQNYGPVYASSVYDEETGDVIVKVVNTLDSDVNVGINVNGANVKSRAKTTVMSGDTSLENSLENKNAIVPVDGEITNAGNSFTYAAPADSFSVIRLSTDGATHKSYISGYDDGTFRPDNTITRAEAAAIIAKLGGIDENKEYENTFNDVAESEWYKNYVNFAKEKGYIEGYDDDTFVPDKVITRGEFAVILGKYLNVDGTQKKTIFSDVPSTHYASGYIQELFRKKIISGYDVHIFKPDNTITRAEAVTMMNKALGLGAEDVSGLGNPFSDVSPSHWAHKEILTAVN